MGKRNHQVGVAVAGDAARSQSSHVVGQITRARRPRGAATGVSTAAAAATTAAARAGAGGGVSTAHRGFKQNIAYDHITPKYFIITIITISAIYFSLNVNLD